MSKQLFEFARQIKFLDKRFLFDILASILLLLYYELQILSKFRIFIFPDLFHGYIDMAGVLQKSGDTYFPRAPDHSSALGPMSVYQIFRKYIYDLDTLTTWFYMVCHLSCVARRF